MLFVHPRQRRRAAVLAAAAGVAAAGTALVTAAPSALAVSGATPERIHIEDSLPAGVICAFPVDIVIDGKVGLIAKKDGTFISTAPAQKATLTNAVTGASQTWSTTGVWKVTVREDGNLDIVFSGQNLMFGGGRFVVTVGQGTGVLDPTTGDFTATPSGQGRTIDACAAVA